MTGTNRARGPSTSTDFNTDQPLDCVWLLEVTLRVA